MNEWQIACVRESVARLRRNMEVFAPAFFDELYAVMPDARNLFASGEAQRSKLGAMLSMLANARDLDRIAPALVRLGARHVEYGVGAAHYQPLAQAVLAALRKTDPDNFDEALQSAWSSLLQDVIGFMQGAAPAAPGHGAADVRPQQDKVRDASLHVAVGGSTVVERVHTRFYRTLFDDEWIGGFFLTKSMQSLILKQTRFMVAAFGGPDDYHWDTPAMAHMHMLVSDEQADIRETLLRNAIRREGLSAEIEERWLRVDQAFRPAIVKQGVDDCVLRCPGQVPVVVPRPANYRPPALIPRTLSSPSPA